MVALDTLNLSAYEAAYQGAAFFPQASPGYLRVSGPDQSSFLQRQTTNDVRLLKPTRAVLTVLTSPTARILDVLYLLQEPEAIGVVTLPGLDEHTARFLKSRIFFMDKVTLISASHEYAQIDLLGPHAPQVLIRLGIERVPEKDEVIASRIEGFSNRILALSENAGLGYRLLAAAEASEAILATLEEQGAARLSSEVYSILRVEAGIPQLGNELTEQYTPLETGLRAAISDQKGCYTGQEIIARQITYDKVTQQMCGLRLESPVNEGERVWAEGKGIGTITSSVTSPTFGHIALGILKRPYHQPETAVKVGKESESGVSGVVTPIPFHSF